MRFRSAAVHIDGVTTLTHLRNEADRQGFRRHDQAQPRTSGHVNAGTLGANLRHFGSGGLQPTGLKHQYDRRRHGRHGQ
jgi:hypothetical protein